MEWESGGGELAAGEGGGPPQRYPIKSKVSEIGERWKSVAGWLFGGAKSGGGTRVAHLWDIPYNRMLLKSFHKLAGANAATTFPNDFEKCFDFNKDGKGEGKGCGARCVAGRWCGAEGRVVASEISPTI